jgi:NADPH:quinone reductase-like Zn-dependent oxidoreductase
MFNYIKWKNYKLNYKMKAVVLEEFGGVDKLKLLTDLPKPEVKEGEILIKIMAAGVNPVDCKIRQGLLTSRLPHHFPIIPGWDLSGIVEQTGYSSKRFKAGDEVFAYVRRPFVQFGTYAEYISIPESYVTFKPKNISFEEAASIPLVGLTAYQSIIEKEIISKGKTVFIIGASGGVGTMAVQLAKIAGAKVIALASSENHDYLKSLGASHTLDYKKGDFVEALKFLEPQGVDIVYDCFGKDALDKAYYCVKKGGWLVSILGQEKKELTTKLGINFRYWFVEPNVVQLDLLKQLIESGQLKTNVSRVFPIEEVREAHQFMEGGHTTGKIVLKIS